MVNKMLSNSQIKQYEELGYASPLHFCTPSQMGRLASLIRSEILAKPADTPQAQTLSPRRRIDRYRYLDQFLEYEIATHPRILDLVRQVIGEDVMLWKSQYFDKKAWGPGLPWHQESWAWKVEPLEVTSVWLALDDATLENGCMKVVTGTHDRIYPKVELPKDHDKWDTFDHENPAELIDPEKIVPIEVKAGEFCLFEDLIHGSDRNNTPHDRTALVFRYSPMHVMVHEDQGYGCITVSGNTRHGKNPQHSPPEPNHLPLLSSILEENQD